MRVLKWLVALLAALALLTGAFVWLGLPMLNAYQVQGKLALPGLHGQVTITRDEKGMAYVQAEDQHDAVMAQGFIHAQDRLFGMELLRRYATGRLSEMVGEKALQLDVMQRALGFARHGRRQAQMLCPEDLAFARAYVDGVNAFLSQCPSDVPLEFKAAGIAPEPWSVADSMACMLQMGWNSSANLKGQIIAMALGQKLGVERAKMLLPLCINPDDPPPAEAIPYETAAAAPAPAGPRLAASVLDDPAAALLLARGPYEVGSNNWVMGPAKTPGGKPILVNDPHLDSRVLPGVWYPCGLATPGFRVVGVGVPGVPGLVAGRNQHVALGMTNAYGDTQDLYIETIDPKDPNRYLEGDKSLPLELITETIKIKDGEAPGGFRQHQVTIRLTRRGPIVSGLQKGLAASPAVSLRWSSFEAMSPNLGITEILKAASAAEVDKAVAQVSSISLNFVFADKDGNIGWRVSGKLPMRARGDGTMPLTVDGGPDDWTGWIPAAEMPHAMNPPRGWVGTANHLTVPRDYKHHYTSHASPGWRYRRMAEVLDGPAKLSVDDHWRLMRDIKNPMAAKLAPIMAAALAKAEDTRPLAKILHQWDFMDRDDQAAPLIFQAVYRRFAYLVFVDELGDKLTWEVLDNPYWWQERLALMVQRGDWRWFDDVGTADVREGVEQLFQKAAREAVAELSPKLGADPEAWRWGDVHRLILVSPLRRSGPGRDLLGGGDMPYGGSGETLMRAIYDYSKPYDVTVLASMRMVADLSDDDKVAAVLPGGVVGRQFSPHFDDQVPAFMDGGMVYWWFSQRAVEQNAQSTLTLRPR